MSIFQQYGDFKDYFRNSPLTVIILAINTIMLLLTYFIGWQEGFGVLDGKRHFAIKLFHK